jgi:hypothetical protein
MDKFKAWLASHKISAKTVAASWAFVTALYYSQPAFHNYVMNAYSHIPKGIHAFIAGVIVPALIFWKSQKGSAQ